MIKSVSVRNIALIDKVELELGARLNILSGETGAGKSLIIDSLGFVLGERADRGLIRYGTDHAVVEAVFEDYLTPDVGAYLDDMGIEPEDVLVIRRKMTADGKNECRINGRVTTLSVLKGLTELLVDIHGQHEHQSLIKPANHEGMLDGIGGKDILSARDKVGTLHAEYRALKEEFSRFGDESERARRLDVLRFQLEEIERADLKAAAASLHTISAFDEGIEPLCDRLDAAKTEIEDIGETLGDMMREFDFDAKSADAVEERLETVRNLQRKYGGSYAAMREFYDKAAAEADTLANASERVEALEREISAKGKELSAAAEKLGALRRKTAESFERAIMKELGDLGMGGTTFKVDIASDYSADSVGATGGDRVEFLISPNVGEPLKPLAKIISGGEMSRFMLALKNIVAGIDRIGTMVFDEIDTGISGHISAVVAEKMCNISRTRQVIAITHMPSLAAMADSHFLIEKGVEDGKTLTRLVLLGDDTDEVARLIGGNDYSSHAVPHAKEMKKWAEEYKRSVEEKG